MVADAIDATASTEKMLEALTIVNDNEKLANGGLRGLNYKDNERDEKNEIKNMMKAEREISIYISCSPFGSKFS